MPDFFIGELPQAGQNPDGTTFTLPFANHAKRENAAFASALQKLAMAFLASGTVGGSPDRRIFWD